jgi:type VI secretion system protein ImpK
MATSDDPFGLALDRGRTRVRPPPAAAPAPQQPGSGSPPARSRRHPNPLVNAFAPLLEFAPELENALPPSDPEALRVRLHGELTASRDAAVAAGVPLATADAAAWAAAALLDDLALNTPWGGASGWPRQPLVVTLAGDVDAGEQFFTRLERLERAPAVERDLLEFHRLCLALGFRGRYRVPGRAGDRSLAAVSAAAAGFARDPEAEAAPLSPHWEGLAAPDEPRRAPVPIWVLFAAAILLATGLYVGMSVRLSGQAENLVALVRALPPPDRAEIYRAGVREPPPPGAVAATEPLEFALVPEFEAAAPPGLRPALRGRETVSLASLTIQWSDPEVFQSARASLTPGFEPLIAALAEVIVENLEVIGAVTVVGHTDSVPLSASNPLASNQRLSEARARAIADLLAAGGVPPDRLRAEGRAATEPVAPNDTREGRALNRRVEVLVEKRL